jgi:CheY-like chemotaxis protein
MVDLLRGTRPILASLRRMTPSSTGSISPPALVRVLWVEDNDLLVDATAPQLRDAGLQLLVARDVDEALAALHPDLDAIVLDWMLGIETAEPVVHEIRHRELVAGIAFLTAADEPEATELARRTGVFAELDKPLSVDAFVGLCRILAQGAAYRRRLQTFARDTRRQGPRHVGTPRSEPTRGDLYLRDTMRRLGRIGRLTDDQQVPVEHRLSGGRHESLARRLGKAASTIKRHWNNALDRCDAEDGVDLFRVLAQDLERPERR